MTGAFLLLSLLAGSSAEQPWLGMTIRPFRDPRAVRMLHVERVVPNGPSARAGMRPGDFIVRINGKSLQHTDDLDVLTFIAERRPGERLRLDVIRNGAPLAIALTVGVMPESARRAWSTGLQNARRARMRAQGQR